jgi:hypothetical protein
LDHKNGKNWEELYGYLENSEILEGIDLPILIISGIIDRYSQHKIDVDISHIL